VSHAILPISNYHSFLHGLPVSRLRNLEIPDASKMLNRIDDGNWFGFSCHRRNAKLGIVEQRQLSRLGGSDMLLRNSNTGGLEVYDTANNQISGAAFIGTVGLDWQFAGIAPIHAPGASDLVLRNVNTGAFEA
jgi:hypothetical protein